MELKNLRIREGGQPQHEEEHEGAHDEGEAAPTATPPEGASASTTVATPPRPAMGTPISLRSATIFRNL